MRSLHTIPTIYSELEQKGEWIERSITENMKKPMIVLILLMTALTGLLFGYWQKYEDQLYAETLGLPEIRIRIQFRPARRSS